MPKFSRVCTSLVYIVHASKNACAYKQAFTVTISHKNANNSM